MISNRWIEKRKPFWERMARLTGAAQRDGVRGLSAQELKELVLLYRQVAGDLSALRQDGGARTYEAHLNTLLARAHTFVYAGRSGGLRGVWLFLARDYPRLFRRLLPYSLASLAVFLGGGLVGALLTAARPAFMEQLLGPHMVDTIRHRQMWTESITSMAPAASSGIMTNNLGVTFATFAAGLSAGLGTLYMIGWNGVLIGVIGTACAHAQMSVKLWSFVAPHGSLELPSIILAGAAGLRLARGIVAPGIYSRGYALALAGQESVRLLAGTIPLLMIAGLLEGFFSPSAAPVWMKFSLGGVLFALLLAWLASSPEATAVPAP